MTVPEHVDVLLADRMDLAGFGRAYSLEGEDLRIRVEPVGVRVYDVWCEIDGSWAQLQRIGEWWHLESHVASGIMRFWLSMDDPTLRASPVLAESTDCLPESSTLRASVGDATVSDEKRPYVPVVGGEPPLPGTRRRMPARLRRWVERRGGEVVVAAVLDEWTLAAGEAAALGWMSGLPRGEDLLPAYAAHALAVPDGAHEEAFARWLTAEVGRAVRAGLDSRRTAEERRPAVAVLIPALARVLRALDPGLEVVAEVPPVIGPRDRHRWLVDGELALALDNRVTFGGAHRPVFMVRPAVLGKGVVLLEGEVV